MNYTKNIGKCNMKRKLKPRGSAKRRSPSIPKRVPTGCRLPPGKRMTKYKKLSNPKFFRFKFVVPSEEDRRELLAALEFIHASPIMDNNKFIVINQLAHGYLGPNDTIESAIVVDEDSYFRIKQQSCYHKTTYTKDGVTYCENCWKALSMQ